MSSDPADTGCLDPNEWRAVNCSDTSFFADSGCLEPTGWRTTNYSGPVSNADDVQLSFHNMSCAAQMGMMSAVGIGCAITGVSAVVVLLSFAQNRQLRRHPNGLVALRTSFDLAFSVSVLGQLGFVDGLSNVDDGTLCDGLAFIDQFFIIGAELWTLCLMIDTVAALHNPFTSVSRNKWLYGIGTVSLALCSALGLSIWPVPEHANKSGGSYSGMSMYGFCWVRNVRTRGLNLASLSLGFGTIGFIYAVCFGLLVHTKIRLRKGLRKTYRVRMHVFNDVFRVVAGYSGLYLCVFMLSGYTYAFYKPSKEERHDASAAFGRYTESMMQDGSLFAPTAISTFLAMGRGGMTLFMWVVRHEAVRRDGFRIFSCKTVVLAFADLCGRSHASSRDGPQRRMSDATALRTARALDDSDRDMAPHLNLALRDEVVAFIRAAVQLSIEDTQRGTNRRRRRSGLRPKPPSGSASFHTLPSNRSMDPSSNSGGSSILSMEVSVPRKGRSSRGWGFGLGGDTSSGALSSGARDASFGMGGSTHGSAGMREPLLEQSESGGDRSMGRRGSSVHSLADVITNDSVDVTSLSTEWFPLALNYDRHKHHFEVPEESSLMDLRYFGATNVHDEEEAASVATEAEDAEIDPPPVKMQHMAPELFARIRRLCRIDDTEFKKALSRTTNEKFSEGASGMFFCSSFDNRYVIKTMSKGDVDTLQRILPRYFEHLRRNPDTLIVKFLACVSLRVYREDIYVVVMENIFETDLEVHDTYDLKGSWVNRSAAKKQKGRPATCRFCNERFIVGSADKCHAKPNSPHDAQVVLKDSDLNFKLRLRPENARRLATQLRADIDFLNSQKLMDYSLLVGVHRTNFKLAASDNLMKRREEAAAAAAAEAAARSRVRTPLGRSASSNAGLRYKRSQDEADVKRSDGGDGDSWVAPSWAPPRAGDDGGGSAGDGASRGGGGGGASQAPDLDPTHVPFFRAEAGGMMPVALEGPGVFYLGVIDILQSWTWSKRIERFIKVLFRCQDRDGISALPPAPYRDRWERRVIEEIIEHGGDSDGFAAGDPDFVPVPYSAAGSTGHGRTDSDASSVLSSPGGPGGRNLVLPARDATVPRAMSRRASASVVSMSTSVGGRSLVGSDRSSVAAQSVHSIQSATWMRGAEDGAGSGGSSGTPSGGRG